MPTLDPISEQLSQARRSAGLDVEDVQFKTRIPKSVVEALEAGDFEAFSSPTYARSFLSQYSAFLGVDASEWLDALQPGGFVANRLVHPWLETPRGESEIHVIHKRSSPAWLSAACLLVLSGGILFAA